jgi:hypothetical protein
LVVLQSRGRQSDADAIAGLHTALVDLVGNDHAGLIESARVGLLTSIEGITPRLQGLEVEDATLRARGERLAQRETRLLEEQARSKAMLDQIVEWQGQAVNREQEGKEGGAMLLLNSMATQYETRVNHLRERVDVELPAEREAVLREIAANAVSRRALEGERASLQSKLGNLQATRALATAARSVHPSGPSRLLIVALATLVGFGLAAAWVAARSASAASGRAAAPPVGAPAQ